MGKMISSLKSNDLEHKSSNKHWPLPNSAKFRGRGIVAIPQERHIPPQLGWKLCSLWKTVVPANYYLLNVPHWTWFPMLDAFCFIRPSSLSFLVKKLGLFAANCHVVFFLWCFFLSFIPMYRLIGRPVELQTVAGSYLVLSCVLLFYLHIAFFWFLVDIIVCRHTCHWYLFMSFSLGFGFIIKERLASKFNLLHMHSPIPVQFLGFESFLRRAFAWIFRHIC